MKKIIVILAIIISFIGALYLLAFLGLNIKFNNSTVEYGLKSSEFKRDVTIFGNKINLNSEMQNNFSLLKLGKHNIKISIKIGFITLKTVNQEISIVDTNKPIINFLGEETIFLKKGDEYKEPGYSASDVVDGDLTNKVKVDNHVNVKVAGTYEIKYIVLDSNNNKTEKKRIIKVTSNELSNTEATDITYIKGILIVNKEYGLPKSYAPFNNKEAENALAKLRSDASKLGYIYKYNCGYRSYNDQTIIYNGYVRDYGQEQADTFSAKPGHSEHQTGLAFDIGEFSES